MLTSHIFFDDTLITLLITIYFIHNLIIPFGIIQNLVSKALNKKLRFLLSIYKSEILKNLLNNNNFPVTIFLQI